MSKIGGYRMLVTLLGSIILLGCARMVVVDVSAIVDPDHQPDATAKKYLLSPDNDNKSNDLYFKEFSSYFERALAKSGFNRTRIKEQANFEIVFSFGLSDRHSGTYTDITPIYDFVGGETITITEKSSDPAVESKVTTIYVPARYERIGTGLESHAYTYFVAHASLEARSITKDTGKSKILWHIQAQSRVTDTDLRKIIPYLAHAATPYIGKNSGHQVSISIEENDPVVVNTTYKH
ncbi:MAG: hypothetical protein OEZ68_13675 [Gammaproteobacteria bacterium]|nr:hypothetical protein [Gammaproteobacteria bacterium]MDH5801851.1 hypothetical protein [Gammaproteobacteria bacterium]